MITNKRSFIYQKSSIRHSGSTRRRSALGGLAALAVLLTAAPVRAQETETLFLSGHDKDDAVPWKFQCTSGAKAGTWSTLPVPSHWDMHGFGSLNYSRDPADAHHEQGLYEHDFTVPAPWKGKRVFLVFDGVMTDAEVTINGQSAGPLHQGSFYQFKYEVTPLIKVGANNRLALTVSKHSANESVNKAERQSDYWVFGGIFRPVYLEALPPQHIARVAIDARAEGRFAATVSPDGPGPADQVEVEIQTTDGKPAAPAFHQSVSGPKVLLESKIANPRLWSAETPNLYQAVFRLKDHGKTVHQYTQRFGFRTFEVRESDGLYLNGQRVILKGANRHSFWPDSGRCLSETVHRLDIQAIKDANMNAVRMSHYPPDARFLDLCDELGLYVLDELAGWQKCYDDEVGAKLVKEMVERDVNHPAILFWDNGNEGGWNTNLDKLFAQHDPQARRVLHPWSFSGGVNTAHYLNHKDASKAAAGVPFYHHPNGKNFADPADLQKTIYMPTEFLHGLYDGGAGAGLDDYWRMMSAHKYLGGGFLWALVDEGVKRPDTGMIDVFGNRAPDGILGPYRQREASFFTVKEIWSPIQVTRDRDFSFTVVNHFSFTDTRQCKFSWELRQFPQPGNDRAAPTVTSRGVAESPSIPPGGKGMLTIKADPGLTADALALRVDDPTGRELWTWVWPIKTRQAPATPHKTSTHNAIATRTEDVIDVKADDLCVKINSKTAMLLGIARGKQPFSLVNGPRPMVGDAKLIDITIARDKSDAIITAKLDGNLKSVVWRVTGEGWVHCDYTYTAEGTHDFLGVMFDYPEPLVRHKQWLGDGPFRVWQNRRRGVTHGLWQNDYNNTLTGFQDWTYPEFKGFFANLQWLQLETTEGRITVINRSPIPFTQVLTPDFGPEKLKAKAFAPVPTCGLGFLDAIPAMGSKFSPGTSTGPHGQPATANGNYSGAVSFYFGKL